MSKKDTQIQTIATKNTRPTKWCLCVDINLYLNKESVTHSRRKLMTRLIQAHSKLSKETQNNLTIENQHEKPASGNAVTGGGTWTTHATNGDLPLQQMIARDTRTTKHHQPHLGSHAVTLTRRSRE
jgi:hypothetical protein